MENEWEKHWNVTLNWVSSTILFYSASTCISMLIIHWNFSILVLFDHLGYLKVTEYIAAPVLFSICHFRLRMSMSQDLWNSQCAYFCTTCSLLREKSGWLSPSFKSSSSGIRLWVILSDLSCQRKEYIMSWIGKQWSKNAFWMLENQKESIIFFFPNYFEKDKYSSLSLFTYLFHLMENCS